MKFPSNQLYLSTSFAKQIENFNEVNFCRKRKFAIHFFSYRKRGTKGKIGRYVIARVEIPKNEVTVTCLHLSESFSILHCYVFALLLLYTPVFLNLFELAEHFASKKVWWHTKN